MAEIDVYRHVSMDLGSPRSRLNCHRCQVHDDRLGCYDGQERLNDRWIGQSHGQMNRILAQIMFAHSAFSLP